MAENKTYELQILPLFEQDLNEIVDYITETLGNPIAANNLVDDVEKAIKHRLSFPESFTQYHSTKDREHPYYRIEVRNYSVFYVVIGNVMEVRRIVYSKRNIENLI